jgi:hypothetical protein
MRKAFVIALVLLGLRTAPAAALDIKNVRATYGPVGGVRPDNKFLPGDILWLAFQIDGLAMEADTGLVKWKVALEVVDNSKDKPIFTRSTDHQRYLALGKGQMSERAQVFIGTEQAPGKYTVRLTITDKGGGKEKGGGPSKSFAYDFEILAPDFGLIQGWAPSVAIATQDYTAFVKLTGMARDAKQLPNVEVRLVIKDESGKAILPKPLVTSIPKDLPSDEELRKLGEEFDIKKSKMIPMPFPLFLNRPGRFTVEIEALDHISKKTSKVSFPLQVLETSSLSAP